MLILNSPKQHVKWFYVCVIFNAHFENKTKSAASTLRTVHVYSLTFDYIVKNNLGNTRKIKFKICMCISDFIHKKHIKNPQHTIYFVSCGESRFTNQTFSGEFSPRCSSL